MCVEDVLKANLRASAENDVVEWMIMRRDRVGSRDESFIALATACDWRNCCGTKRRFAVPLWIWQKTGVEIFVVATNKLFSCAGIILRSLRH